MSTQVLALTRDEAQITSRINSFATMADQGAYEYLGRLLTPEVTVDYTSLFGGEVHTVKREVLMQQWAGFLPGFDITLHQLSNLVIEVQGKQAVAAADVTASHWLGEQGFWAVVGRYSYTLQKRDDSWYISSVTLVAQREEGSRDVLSLAPARAAANLRRGLEQRVRYAELPD